ncbi:hypothetical protein FOL47_002346 [Perkinsus chesapeaki]|uniref:Uncharacterized protein n=1 Tax=Perkinsus chesapeaki TaxID=330153 RepID=A0A7J6MFQ5_PERCH|nr:hypothetical protein FOL47_002346 [Perkinsus chesapeaki]
MASLSPERTSLESTALRAASWAQPGAAAVQKPVPTPRATVALGVGTGFWMVRHPPHHPPAWLCRAKKNLTLYMRKLQLPRRPVDRVRTPKLKDMWRARYAKLRCIVPRASTAAKAVALRRRHDFDRPILDLWWPFLSCLILILRRGYIGGDSITLVHNTTLL